MSASWFLQAITEDYNVGWSLSLPQDASVCLQYHHIANATQPNYIVFKQQQKDSSWRDGTKMLILDTTMKQICTFTAKLIYNVGYTLLYILYYHFQFWNARCVG